MEARKIKSSTPREVTDDEIHKDCPYFKNDHRFTAYKNGYRKAISDLNPKSEWVDSRLSPKSSGEYIVKMLCNIGSNHEAMVCCSRVYNKETNAWTDNQMDDLTSTKVIEWRNFPVI